MSLLRAAVVLLGLLSLTAAGAQPRKGTALLEVDLRAGKKTRIDAPTDSLDAQMDALLGQAVGSAGSFSTKELERVEQKLVAELRRDRPRATPHLIVFVYPGRVDADKLRRLSEVFVDIEILIDPCSRAVCREAVGRHLEMVGRAVGRPVQQSAGYRLVFRTLVLRTMTQFRGNETEEYRVPIADCVAAGARRGGGNAYLDRMGRAAAQYEPLVAKAIVRQAARRRVRLIGPPHVSRESDAADAVLHIRGDRNRLQTQVLDALVAAAEGLRENPTTPPRTSIDVLADVPLRGVTTQRFRCLGQPVFSLLDRKLDAGTLWGTYVRDLTPKKGVTNFAFDDDEAAGRARPRGPAANDAEAVEVLAKHFAPLRDCARAEVARNRRFTGVTLVFRWLPSGRADSVTVKERALRGGALEGCLARALGTIRFPEFDGAPHEVEFPIRVTPQR